MALTVAGDGDYGEVTTTAAIPQSTNWTLAGWVRVNSLSGGDNEVFSLTGAKEVDLGWNGSAFGGWHTSYFTTTSNPPADGTWFYCYETFNLASSTVEVGWWDGAAWVTGSISATSFASSSLSVGNASTFTSGLNGSLAYARCWSSTLTQTQLEAEKDSTTAVVTANLLDDWPLISNTTEVSGNGVDLTLSGAAGFDAADPLGGAAPSFSIAGDITVTVTPGATTSFSGSSSYSLTGDITVEVTPAATTSIERYISSSVSTNVYPQATALVFTPANETVTAAAGAASLTVSGQVPTVTTSTSIDSIVTAASASLVLTGQVPTIQTSVSTDAIMTAASASLTVSGQVPTVTTSTSIDSIVTAASASLTVSGQVPTIQTSVSIDAIMTAGAASLTVSGQVPTVTTTTHINLVVTSGTSTLTIAGMVPLLEAGGNLTVEPITAIVSISGTTPTIQGDCRVTIENGHLHVSSDDQGLAIGVAEEAQAADLVINGYAPSLSTSTAALLQPGTASITLTGLAPTIHTGAGVLVSVATGMLEVSGLSAEIHTGTRVQARSADIIVSGNAIEVVVPLRQLVLDEIQVRPVVYGEVFARTIMDADIDVEERLHGDVYIGPDH